jgi:hypothetical protein
VHSPRGFDDRLLQQYFIERMTQSPEVVVLGSSRTMQARSNLFPGRTFHNHAVQGACLEDEIAFLQMYRLRGFRPSIIVLTVDPWLFNADNALIAWKSIDTYYYDYAREKKLRWRMYEVAPKDPPPFFLALADKAAQQFSLLNASRLITQTMKNIPFPVYKTRNDVADVRLLRTDGSFAYDLIYRTKSPEAVAAEARSFALDMRRISLGNYRKVSEELQEAFVSFLDTAREQGSEVVLYFPPYNPAIYDEIHRHPLNKFDAVESYVRGLGRQRNLRIVGGYDPALTRCTVADFYDGIHPKEEALPYIFGVAQR